MGATELVNYLDSRAKEYHRGTVRYKGNQTDVVYLRDDIRKVRLESQIDRMLTRLRPEASTREEQSFPFGELRTTVRVFEDAIVLHFPTGHDRGIVVSLEPETARDLNTFIGECQRRIRG